MSLILNAKNNVTKSKWSEHIKEGIDNPIALMSVNHDHKNATNIMENIIFEEKKAIILDLLKSDPVQGTLYVRECECQEGKNWLGSKVT